MLAVVVGVYLTELLVLVAQGEEVLVEIMLLMALRDLQIQVAEAVALVLLEEQLAVLVDQA
jgi:hypothetical protein